jgi:hypothetical protein
MVSQQYSYSLQAGTVRDSIGHLRHFGPSGSMKGFHRDGLEVRSLEWEWEWASKDEWKFRDRSRDTLGGAETFIHM